MYTPVSESAASTSSYLPAATEVEDLAGNDAAYARHLGNNDPEREAMLSGDHINNSGQFSAGLNVSEERVILLDPNQNKKSHSDGGVSKCW